MFIDKIKKICNENKRVAMFVDMDGTIVEYRIFNDDRQLIEIHEATLSDENPIIPIIENLKEINKIENIDLYILSLAKTIKIKEEKKRWLRKYMDFIKEENWIILTKENGEYDSDNRDYIKGRKMNEKSSQYDFFILLDDDHKILKNTMNILKENVKVFHISSALI